MQAIKDREIKGRLNFGAWISAIMEGMSLMTLISPLIGHDGGVIGPTRFGKINSRFASQPSLSCARGKIFIDASILMIGNLELSVHK